MLNKRRTTDILTSRERVIRAIIGKPIDRIPIMTWLNPHTTCRLMSEFHPSKNKLMSRMGSAIWKRFEKRGGMESDPITRALPFLMEESGNGEYGLELGSDIAILSPGFISPAKFLSSIQLSKHSITVDGPFGGKMALSGIYMHPIEPAVNTPKELGQLALPKVTKRHFKEIRKFRKNHPDSCLLVEIGAMQQVLCDYILGSEAFMYALYDYPGEIKSFMEKMSLWLQHIIALAAEAGADVIFLQDDYGANNRPLIAMNMWERITLPNLARLIQTSHDHHLPFMLHSCGYQMPFLQHYVRIGLDILQSMQIGAGNDLRKAYVDTQGDLAFATGMDVQLAENDSPLEIRKQIENAYQIGMQHGKYILAMTHMLQHTLALEKYKVIFEFLNEISRTNNEKSFRYA